MKEYPAQDQLLAQRELQQFFLEHLLWDKPRTPEQTMVLKNESYRVIPIAQRAGYIVFVVESENVGKIPSKVDRKRLARKIRKMAHEHLLIFIRPPTYSIWHWMKRDEHHERKLNAHHLTDEQLRLFDQLKFDDPNISITAVTERVSRTLKAMCTQSSTQGGTKMATIDKAFDTLLDAFERTEGALRQQLTQLEIEQMQTAVNTIKALTAVEEKARTLKNEWLHLKQEYPLLDNLNLGAVFSKAQSHPSKRVHRGKSGDRLPTGLRTPESAYRVPILRALVELGGRGAVADVLNRVYEQMKEQLNEHDLSLLNRGGVRWRNVAMFARNDLKDEGYLRKDSPKGIWEITDQGREYLKGLEGGQ